MGKKKPTLFIVEDDPAFNKLLTVYFSTKGKWEVHSFLSGEEAISSLHLQPIIVLEDFDLPGINGMEVMKQTKKKLPETEFIFLSGQGDLKTAVDIFKQGAFDYIVKDYGAKENALNKVDQIMKIKKLEADKKLTQKLLIVVSTLLIIMALSFILLFWFLK